MVQFNAGVRQKEKATMKTLQKMLQKTPQNTNVLIF